MTAIAFRASAVPPFQMRPVDASAATGHADVPFAPHVEFAFVPEVRLVLEVMWNPLAFTRESACCAVALASGDGPPALINVTRNSFAPFGCFTVATFAAI